ncbi:MAG: NfeD family protein [Planctomycetota bacterium]
MNALDGTSIAVLLTFVGSLLLIAEVFFPSGGALGFLSAASFIGAIYSAATAGGWMYGLGFAAVEVLLLPVLLYIAFNVLPRTPIGRALIGTAPTAEEVLPADDREKLVGRVGVARSKMLPAGAIEIDGKMLDAVSQGQAIDPGEYVKVIEASRTRVVVRRASTDERPDPAGPAAEDALARPAEEIGLSDFEFDAPDDDTTSRDA